LTIGAATDAVTTGISSSASSRIRGLRASAASIHGASSRALFSSRSAASSANSGSTSNASSSRDSQISS
jgi:hypothetical protein